MGKVETLRPVKLFVGMLTSFPDLFDEVQSALENSFGRIEDESPIWDFTWTDYYDAEMGQGIEKKFFSFADLIDPVELAAIKLQTNEIEVAFADRYKDRGVTRPINLDPGYLEASKLVLATTKNYSHRIYIGEGIYAEVTLLYRKDGFQTLEWTYPDFQSPGYNDFFQTVRERYMDQIKR